jgi:hypothetical protein
MMALDIIENPRWETDVEYRLEWDSADDPCYGWTFPCDANGHVDESALQPQGLDTLRKCRAGSGLYGQGVVFVGVRRYTRTFLIPAIARCHFGARLELASSWLNTCDVCGRDYDGSGTALAPRHHWGEETGEHWADLVAL